MRNFYFCFSLGQPAYDVSSFLLASSLDTPQAGANDTGAATTTTAAQLTTTADTAPTTSAAPTSSSGAPPALSRPSSAAALPSDSASTSPAGDASDRPTLHSNRKQSLTAALASLRLPGPGYELESLPPTPTMLDRNSPYPGTVHRPSSGDYHANFLLEDRSISTTPALSRDPMHALKVSISQGGGFYMSEEDQARVQQQQQHQSILSSAAEEGQFRPPTSSRSLSDSRSLSSDSDQDYFSISSISPSSSLSSRRRGGNEIVFSHKQEDSGYIPAENYYRSTTSGPDSTSHSNSNSPVCSYDVLSSDLRRLNRPSLTLHSNSLTQSKSLNSLSRTDSFADLSQYDVYPPLKTPSPQSFQNNLTPRMRSSSDWPTATSRSFHETPSFNSHYEGAHEGRYATSPADQQLFHATERGYEGRPVSRSFSVCWSYNFPVEERG